MISQYIHNICVYNILYIYIYIILYIHDSDWLNYSKSIGIGENFNTLWQTLHFLLHHKTE